MHYHYGAGGDLIYWNLCVANAELLCSCRGDLDQFALSEFVARRKDESVPGNRNGAFTFL